MTAPYTNAPASEQRSATTAKLTCLLYMVKRPGATGGSQPVPLDATNPVRTPRRRKNHGERTGRISSVQWGRWAGGRLRERVFRLCDEALEFRLEPGSDGELPSRGRLKAELQHLEGRK